MKNVITVFTKKTAVSKLALSMYVVAIMASVPCFAAGPELAKPLVQWIAAQLSWVAIGVGLFMAVKMAMQRSIFGVVGSLVGGGFIAYIMANPDKLQTWGSAIGGLMP